MLLKIKMLFYNRYSSTAVAMSATAVLLFFFLLGLSSCKDQNSKNPLPQIVSGDSAAVYAKRDAESRIRKVLAGENVRFFESGSFQDTLSTAYAAGVEYSSKDQMGIRFYCFSPVQDGQYKKIFSSPLLNGSFESALVKKIKIATTDNELIYYNSQDYFMGSGGGEIFSYIIDAAKGKVYYAHFFTVPQKPVSLFISREVDRREIRDFFVRVFKKDYPDMKLVNKDYDLENIF